jgi:hypothetical protein
LGALQPRRTHPSLRVRLSHPHFRLLRMPGLGLPGLCRRQARRMHAALVAAAHLHWHLWRSRSGRRSWQQAKTQTVMQQAKTQAVMQQAKTQMMMQRATLVRRECRRWCIKVWNVVLPWAGILTLSCQAASACAVTLRGTITPEGGAASEGREPFMGGPKEDAEPVAHAYGGVPALLLLSFRCGALRKR